jgi:hypothetical protein
MDDGGGANCRSWLGSADAQTQPTLSAPTDRKTDCMCSHALGTSCGMPPFATPDDTAQFRSAWSRTVR